MLSPPDMARLSLLMCLAVLLAIHSCSGYKGKHDKRSKYERSAQVRNVKDRHVRYMPEDEAWYEECGDRSNRNAKRGRKQIAEDSGCCCSDRTNRNSKRYVAVEEAEEEEMEYDEPTCSKSSEKQSASKSPKKRTYTNVDIKEKGVRISKKGKQEVTEETPRREDQRSSNNNQVLPRLKKSSTNVQEDTVKKMPSGRLGNNKSHRKLVEAEEELDKYLDEGDELSEEEI